MGVNLLIFSNHSIKGNSYAEKVKDIELKLKSNIELIPNVPHQKVNIPETTSKCEEVIYYSDVLDAGKDFEVFNEISIKTNYRWYSGLRIFENTMLITPNGFSTDTCNWKLYLGDEFEKATSSQEYSEYNQCWKEFQKFHREILIKLGGSQTVYIDDHSFQEPEDLFYQRKKMNKIIPELEKIGPLFEIEDLYNKFEEISEKNKYYGFKDELNLDKRCT